MEYVYNKQLRLWAVEFGINPLQNKFKLQQQLFTLIVEYNASEGLINRVTDKCMRH